MLYCDAVMYVRILYVQCYIAVTAKHDTLGDICNYGTLVAEANQCVFKFVVYQCSGC